MKALRPFLPALVLSLMSLVLVALVYERLPMRLPVHWNISGEVDGWLMKPWGALLLPLSTVALVLLQAILSTARKDGVNGGVPRVFPILATAGAGFMLFLIAVQLLVALNVQLSMPLLLTGATGVFLAIIGNYLGKLPRNPFVGIRVPWTLASDHVWERTHRFAAPLVVMAGLALLVVSFTQPERRILTLALVILTAALLPPVIYSYLLWRRISRAGG